MYALGFLAYLCAVGLVALVVTLPRGWLLAVMSVPAFLMLYGTAHLIDWAFRDGPLPWTNLRSVQLWVIGLFALSVALVPTGLLRPFAKRPWAAPAALWLALFWPVLCVAVQELFGVERGPFGSGWGHLGELHFLNPVAMGEGVSRDGFVPHRFRVHHLGLAGMVLLGLALQFLPELPARGANRREPVQEPERNLGGPAGSAG